MEAQSEKPLSIGVIGAGFIADYHIDGIRSAGGAEIAAIVGRRRAAVDARARQLRIARAETDYRRILDDPSIDAVVIATPDDSHEAIAVAALQAGKEVLLQKPMAMTSEGCRNVLAAAETSAAGLSVSFMHRYFDEVIWLRDLLRSGRLGSLHAFRIRNATPGADWNEWFYRPGAAAGGVVMQLGVHGIDLCRHLFGPTLEIGARMAMRQPVRHLRDGTRLTSSLEDNAAATYVLKDDVIGSHDMSYTETAGCDRFRLEVHAEHGTVWLRTERGAATLFAPQITGVKDWVTPDLPRTPPGLRHHRHWIDVARGLAPRDDTAEAGYYSIRVAETIYRAATARRWMALDEGGAVEC